MKKINKNQPLTYLLRAWGSRLKSFWNKTSKSLLLFVIVPAFLLLVFAGDFFITVYPPPAEFPVNKTITISEGSTLSEIASSLEEKKIIRSSFWLEVLGQVFGNERQILAGKYIFNEQKNIFEIAQAISKGGFEPKLVKVTIPEGATSFQIAELYSRKIKDFDEKEFLAKAISEEGSLFPDTYYIPPEVEEGRLVKKMKNNFKEHFKKIKNKIDNVKHSKKEIVVMASLLEEEARKYENKRVISGILWKRLKKGMLLQVDAVFGYINGKNTFELTLRDLQNTSPYNTYRYKGLPKGPISNPGMESLKAAANPVETDYLYYLSDMRGRMHYSKTLEEHQWKKRKYLN